MNHMSQKWLMVSVLLLKYQTVNFSFTTLIIPFELAWDPARSGDEKYFFVLTLSWHSFSCTSVTNNFYTRNVRKSSNLANDPLPSSRSGHTVDFHMFFLKFFTASLILCCFTSPSIQSVSPLAHSPLRDLGHQPEIFGKKLRMGMGQEAKNSQKPLGKKQQ